MSSLLTILQVLISPTALKWYMTIGPLVSLGCFITLFLRDLFRFRKDQYISLENLDTLAQPHYSSSPPPSPFIYINPRTAPYWLKFIHYFAIISLLGSLFGLLFPFPQLTHPPLPLITPIAVDATRPLILEFDRPVSANQLELNLLPPATGQWIFRSRKYTLLNWLSFHNFLSSVSTRNVPSNNPGLIDTVIFYPADPLTPNTEFTVTINRIQPLLHHLKPQDLLFTFTTTPSPHSPISDSQPASQQGWLTNNLSAGLSAIDLSKVEASAKEENPPLNPSTSLPNVIAAPTSHSDTALQYPTEFKLPVPLRQQHYKFTCFAAAAQMALAFYNVDLSERTIWDQLPKQTTPRNVITNTWGDPSLGVVGTIDGSGSGGYGAHWEPVAQLLSHHRSVEIKRQWNIADALKEVHAGHPVIVWWINGVWPAKDISWNVPDDGKVHTINGMHTEVITGWQGDIAKPTTIFTNDPWRGFRKYSPDQFNNLWKWFDNTAIIIR